MPIQVTHSNVPMGRRGVGWNDGNKASRRALRARDGSSRGPRGCSVLQAPLLGAADSKRWDCSVVRGVLSEVPEVTRHEAMEILERGSKNRFGNGDSASCGLVLQSQV